MQELPTREEVAKLLQERRPAGTDYVVSFQQATERDSNRVATAHDSAKISKRADKENEAAAAAAKPRQEQRQ